jgi:hypothetical protein
LFGLILLVIKFYLERISPKLIGLISQLFKGRIKDADRSFRFDDFCLLSPIFTLAIRVDAVIKEVLFHGKVKETRMLQNLNNGLFFYYALISIHLV